MSYWRGLKAIMKTLNNFIIALDLLPVSRRDIRYIVQKRVAEKKQHTGYEDGHPHDTWGTPITLNLDEARKRFMYRTKISHVAKFTKAKLSSGIN